MEEFQLITQGKCAKEMSAAEVAAKLRERRIPDPQIRKMLSGDVAVIKKSQTWEAAKRLQKNLYQLGLLTELRLQLNPQVFRQGLIKKALNAHPPVKAQISLTPEATFQPQPSAEAEVVPAKSTKMIWGMEKKSLLPALLARPCEFALLSARGQSRRRMELASAYWNPAALLVTALVVGLVLQGYLIRVAVNYWNLQSMATVLGLLFLVVVAVVLPRLLQARAWVSIYDDGDKTALHVWEQGHYLLGSKHYVVLGDNGEVVATMVRSLKSAYLNTVDGQQWSWQPDVQVSEAEDETVETLQEELADDSLLGTLFEGFDYLLRIRNFFKPAPKFTRVDWEKFGYRLIIDGTGKPVARVFADPLPGLHLIQSELSTRDQLLATAFAVAIIRPGFA